MSKSETKNMEKVKRPLKAENLKIIDHLGTLYATFDGSSLWKIERSAFNILRMCDGKKTVEELVSHVSEKIGHRAEDVRPVVEQILKELEDMKFLEFSE